MGADQTPDAQDSVQVHYKTRRGDETLTIPRNEESIVLSYHGIQTIDLTPLSSCNNLQELFLDSNEFQSIDLSPLSSCNNLQTLSLSMTLLQSIDLTPLSSCRHLKELQLSYDGFQGVNLTPLSSCRNLQILDLIGDQLQSIDLNPLSSCNSLRSLLLGRNDLQSLDLTPLSSCASLQTLELFGNQLQSLDLTPLASCTSLQSLGLWHNQLQGIDLTPLSSCRNLRILRLDQNHLQSIDLTPLSRCTGLRHLDLWANQLHTIDLTPLSSCSDLRGLSLASDHLHSITCSLCRETLQLLAPPLVKRMRPPVRTAEGQVPSGTDLVVLSRVVDTLWRLADASGRWRAYAVVQDVLSRLRLGWLGLLDGDPCTVMGLIGDTSDRHRLTESIIEMQYRAINEGSSALGLDVETAADCGMLAASLPKVLRARQEEVKFLRIRTGTKNADLRPLWVTDLGFRVLSSLGLGTRCALDELKEVRNLLSGLGVQLDSGARKATTGGTVSGPMSGYIWKLADLRARMKKRKKR